MVEQITFQVIFQFLQTVSIMVGILYYFMILNNQQKSQKTALESRNTQFFLSLYTSMMDEKGLHLVYSDLMGKKKWTNFDEWWELYNPEHNIEGFTTWLNYVVTYEMFGSLLKRGFLDKGILDDLLSGVVLMAWDIYEPIIMGIRVKFGWPQFQEHHEYLTEEIRKMVAQQHPDFEGKQHP